MRRILAIVLMLAFGSPFVLPLFASTTDLQSALPACCRRNGAHHCSGMVSAFALGGTAFRAPTCPMYPSPAIQLRVQQVSFNAPAPLFAEALSHPAMQRQTEARARVALDRARHKRGPPATRLS